MKIRNGFLQWGALIFSGAVFACTARVAFACATGLAFAYASATMAAAQDSPLPLPPAVEKELAAKASDVTEVTLGKNMLGFAAKFMDGKDEDEAATRKLIEGLQGIYVREYDFDKEGEYSIEQIEELRKYFETSEWTPIIRERERRDGKTHETTDVLLKMVNGESHGMFVLEADPKELTIVLILGPINVDDLAKLKGIGGLGSLGDVQKDIKGKKGGGE